MMVYVLVAAMWPFPGCGPCSMFILLVMVQIRQPGWHSFLIICLCLLSACYGVQPAGPQCRHCLYRAGTTSCLVVD